MPLAAIGTERAGSTVEWWQLTLDHGRIAGAWRPRADVYETADGVLVTVELAGLEADDLDVQLFEDALIVEVGDPSPRRGPTADITRPRSAWAI